MGRNLCSVALMHLSIARQSIAAALFILLAACAGRSPPAYAYQTGYETGCARGYADEKPQQTPADNGGSPYASEQLFRQGWQQGYAACIARNSAALRPFLD